ncbi:MAG TPA: substrate-binding domain-containing protein [Armatimonadota bacterium]|nr:substrate-binding domain-containing protein [Armatimonadota bacterium]
MQDISFKHHRSPAVRRLLTELIARIRSGALRPGDYLPSAHALAAHYGIGYVSVIRAYKTLSEAGLVETVRGRGAFVRAAAPAALTDITVVLGSQQSLTLEGNPHTAWVFQWMLSGMNAGTLARNVRMQLQFADVVGEQWRAVVDALPAEGGVLFLMSAPPAWVMRLHRRGIPYGVVLPGQYSAWDAELPRAIADYRGSVRAATAAVLARGPRRAAFLGVRDGDDHETPRYLGFLDALAAAGLAEPIIIPCPSIDPAVARATMRDYLAAHPGLSFDFLVCGNDLRALGALEALAEGGLRVPDDVAVLGFDDIPAAAAAGLSTVRLPVRDLGEASIHWLLDTVAADPASLPAPLTLPCPPVWRASTARC